MLMPSYVEIHMYPDLHLHLCRNKHHLAVRTAARRSVLEHSPRKRKVQILAATEKKVVPVPLQTLINRF